MVLLPVLFNDGIARSYFHSKRNPKDTTVPLHNEEALNYSIKRTPHRCTRVYMVEGGAWLAKSTPWGQQLFSLF